SGASGSATNRPDSLAHVEAAGWGQGVSTLVRITRMALRHPWQAGLAIAATVVAAGLQLMIPPLLGQAVDQTQIVLQGGTAGDAAEATLLVTALVLLA